MKNYEKLIQSQNIPLNIVQQEHNITYNEIDDVDFSLYSGSFLSSNDQDRCSIIRETKKEELKEIDFHLMILDFMNYYGVIDAGILVKLLVKKS